jgi:hypothetical protein
MTYNDVLTNEIDWNEDFKSLLQKELLEGLHLDYCFVRGQISKGVTAKFLPAPKHQDATVTYPDVEAEYKEPERCTNGSTSQLFKLSMIWLFQFSFIF